MNLLKPRNFEKKVRLFCRILQLKRFGAELLVKFKTVECATVACILPIFNVVEYTTTGHSFRLENSLCQDTIQNNKTYMAL